jgi:1-acyl-sn-glycerol-3-phosphate acyltransferase
MGTWRPAGALQLDVPFIARLMTFPREPDPLACQVRRAINVALRGYLRAYHRLQIVGRERLDIPGSFVIVSNHASHLDALCLLTALPMSRLDQAFPAAATDYFFSSLPRVALSVLAVNALPFDRAHHVRQSMNRCRKLLEQSGNILIAFPEGTRSTTGRINPFKPGIARLVAGTGIPGVPCYVDGAFRAWPKGGLLPKPSRLRLIVGAPRTYADACCDHNSTRRICRDLHAAVADLKRDFP